MPWNKADKSAGKEPMSVSKGGADSENETSDSQLSSVADHDSDFDDVRNCVCVRAHTRALSCVSLVLERVHVRRCVDAWVCAPFHRARRGGAVATTVAAPPRQAIARREGGTEPQHPERGETGGAS